MCSYIHNILSLKNLYECFIQTIAEHCVTFC